jgi:hypothetical protein
MGAVVEEALGASLGLVVTNSRDRIGSSQCRGLGSELALGKANSDAGTAFDCCGGATGSYFLTFASFDLSACDSAFSSTEWNT